MTSGNDTESNSYKSRHGAKVNELVQSIIEHLKKIGAIKSSRPNPKYGYPDLKSDQFDARQEVSFTNGEKAVLYTTSTVRSDRVSKDQWRAFNTKQIDSHITYAYLIVPDESAYDQGTAPRDQIRHGEIFSAIDDIKTVQEFYDFTTERHFLNLEKGIADDLQGRAIERLFAEILENTDNYSRYIGDVLCTGFFYTIYERVLQKLEISPSSLINVTATNVIKKLPSGGNPKTDVAATFIFQDGTQQVATFSLKSTGAKSVSVHEYSADQFADVLNPNDDNLRHLLNSFQAAGSASGMPEGEADALTAALHPYKDTLNHWVLSGKGGAISDQVQVADYIVVRDKNSGSYAIHDIAEYCQALEEKHSGKSGFGTIFSWTYPSKKRGQKIQLKAKILL